jgi:hypothetical protein
MRSLAEETKQFERGSRLPLLGSTLLLPRENGQHTFSRRLSDRSAAPL